MNLNKRYKRLFSLKKRYYILLFICCTLLLVGLITAYKSLAQEPTYVYIKLKVNQGLWWATTEKPPFWYTQAIQKGDTAYGLLNSPEATILDKRSYLRSENDVFDIYLTLKIKVTKNSESYIYNRSTISIGAPLEIQFPKETISGTVIALSNTNFSEQLVEKVIYATKSNTESWEYNTIKLGATLSDGKHTIITILDKEKHQIAQLSPDSMTNQEKINIKAKIRVKEGDGIYILGEEKIITPGRPLNLSFSSFSLKDFIITHIE